MPDGASPALSANLAALLIALLDSSLRKIAAATILARSRPEPAASAFAYTRRRRTFTMT